MILHGPRTLLNRWSAGWPTWAWRLALWLMVAAACLGVFALYTSAQIMVTLADQLWACF